MTEEQFEALDRFEKHFRTATRLNYVRMNSAESKELVKVYNDASGQNMKINSCMGCGGMRNVKIIAAFYYAEKEKQENENKVVEVLPSGNTTSYDEKPKRKRRVKQNEVE